MDTTVTGKKRRSPKLSVQMFLAAALVSVIVVALQAQWFMRLSQVEAIEMKISSERQYLKALSSIGDKVSTQSDDMLPDSLLRQWDGLSSVLPTGVEEDFASQFESAAKAFSDAGADMQAREEILSSLMPQLRNAEAAAWQRAQDGEAALTEAFKRGQLVTWVLLSLAVLASLIVAWVLTRRVHQQLGGDPSELAALAEALANGSFVPDDNASHGRQGAMRELLSIRQVTEGETDDSAESVRRNHRLKQSLDNVGNSIIVTDSKGKFIYQNLACEKLLQTYQKAIASNVAGFTSDKLVGSDRSLFGEGAAAMEKLVSGQSSTEFVYVKIQDCHLKLTGTRVTDTDGQGMGYVLEIEDRTTQAKLESEIESIVNSAKRGVLDSRITMDGKEGFFSRLSGSINELVDINERVITESANAISALAAGDLSCQVRGTYEGAFGKLTSDINKTIDKLTGVVGGIRNSSNEVLSAAAEIMNGNTDLSHRTEQQAASLEETASQMLHMTSTVHQNAENANQANQLASEARNSAEQGGEVVNRAVESMKEITDSSRKIADITGVIDEIAFQTNLLALNAAVEAARAGEQGRGFAVVASEVRNLAGRSAVAAKEIKDLITDSVAKVEEGSRLVDHSGDTLDEIMNSVKKVSDIVAEISQASTDQSRGIEQMNQAVSEMDEMTQKNAALVEEAAAASESLNDQASNLNSLIAFFSGGGGTGFNATPTASSAQKPGATPAVANKADDEFSAAIARTPSPAISVADTKARKIETPTYSGPERRKSERPWGDAAAKSKVSSTPASTTATPPDNVAKMDLKSGPPEKNNGPEAYTAMPDSDSDWEEF